MITKLQRLKLHSNAVKFARSSEVAILKCGKLEENQLFRAKLFDFGQAWDVIFSAVEQSNALTSSVGQYQGL